MFINPTTSEYKYYDHEVERLKIASQMLKPHSLQASGKHHEIVTLGSQNIKSVAMAIVVRRLKTKVN